MPRVLLIDNYDSFTFNLVQALRTLGAEVVTHRNNAISVAECVALEPTHLVISPGPGRPEHAGISMDLIQAMLGKVPLLGVCLGHQALVASLGGKVVRASRLMHGKSSRMYHDGRGIYLGIPNPFAAGRYHSLIADDASMPSGLTVSSYTSGGEIMGVRSEKLGAEGVQFHPESILTPDGPDLLLNFLEQQTSPLRQNAA